MNVKWKFLGRAGICAAIGALVILSACTITTSGSTLTGSLTAPASGASVSGKYVYVKLVSANAPSTSSALYWTRVQFNAGFASYAITGITPGTYTLWAFIDANNDAGYSATAQPDSGDYTLPATANVQVTIPTTTTQNIPTTSGVGWVTVP